MEELLQNLLQRIDCYIEESLDENFDRYLEQMKQILAEHPEQAGEVSRSVEENMQRYRTNQALLQRELEQGQSEAGQPEEEPRREEAQAAPVSGHDGFRGSSVEFKIGIGVLSGIGVLFVLVGLVILAHNFLPDVMQGMMMLCFFALVWIVSQLCLHRLAQKLALGCTAAGIVGVYLSIILNYYEFDSFSRWLTCGLFAVVGMIAWASGRFSRSGVIQCTGAVGFLFLGLFLPWGDTVPAYIAMLVITVVLNVLWQMGASGHLKYAVQMTHQITFLVCSLIFAFRLSLERIPGGVAPVWIYCVILAILVNLFYLNKEDTGFFIVWLCSMVLICTYSCGVWLANMIQGNMWWNCVLLALAAANTVFLFIKKFRWRYQGFYYQAGGALLLLSNCDTVWWIGLIATVVLFLLGLWKIREHPLLQEMIMLAVLSLEILVIPTDYAFLISLLLMGLAILAIIAGFVRRELPLRIYGLCLSLFACAKVILYDFWDLELLQKSLLFLSVGIIAILISVIYAVLEQQQKKQRRKEEGSEELGMN